MADRSATGPSGEDKPLRQRVDELEATVRGLTQELVETTERLRELEAELEETAGGRAGSANDVNTRTAEPDDTDADAETDGDGDDDLTEQDDIIVA